MWRERASATLCGILAGRAETSALGGFGRSTPCALNAEEGKPAIKPDRTGERSYRYRVSLSAETEYIVVFVPPTATLEFLLNYKNCVEFKTHCTLAHM